MVGRVRGKRENTPKTRLANGVMRARRVLDLHADRHAPQEHGHVLRVHVRVAALLLLEAHDVRPVQDHEQHHVQVHVHQRKASTAIMSLAEEICIVVRISLDRCVICAPVRSLARRRGPPCRRCSRSHRPTRWTTERDCSAEPITIFRSGGGPLRSIAAIIYILCDGKARARQKSVRWWWSRSHLGAL